jgi:dTDP-4-amino-4,6-dideoxygalactose transaminase
VSQTSRKQETLGSVEIPLVDLGPMSRAVAAAVLDRFAATIERGDFANGAAIAEFERRFAEYCGAAECVAVASGLDALRLALLASGLENGAGVIVPAATFAATFEAVLQAGGVPVVADVDPRDYCVDVDRVRSVVSGSTHIVPVHLYGQMADMQELERVAEAHAAILIEDACQAHGAVRGGIAPGQAARAAAFSFYPTKNLGAMGDGGAVVTSDAELAARVRALREHGETRKYHHEYVGYTSRLDTIQASVLLEKLPFLDEWNRQRREAARFYTEALGELEGLILPSVPEGSEAVWHLYVIRTEEPERLATFLAARGIQTGRHYPEPPHLAPAYRHLGFAPGDFPVAESLSREAVSLPLYPGIQQAQLETVCEALSDYVQA